MSEPTTEAGRRLLDVIGGMDPQGLYPPDPKEMVAAIEAEARADLARRIEAKLAEMPAHEFIDTYEPGTLWRAVDLGAVLAAIREEAAR